MEQQALHDFAYYPTGREASRKRDAFPRGTKLSRFDIFLVFFFAVFTQAMSRFRHLPDGPRSHLLRTGRDAQL